MGGRMANATTLMAKIDGKNVRFKEYLVKRKHSALTLMDRFRFNFRSYAKAGLTELPTFQRTVELGNEKEAYKKMHGDVWAALREQAALLNKKSEEIGMYNWLISLPDGKGKTFQIGRAHV